MSDRLTDISNNFTENRDILYRDRMRSLQTDMNYINNASPYDNKALEEIDEEEQASQHQNGGSRGQGISSQKALQQPPLGMNARLFVQEVNDSMEERDAQLVRLTVSISFILLPESRQLMIRRTVSTFMSTN